MPKPVARPGPPAAPLPPIGTDHDLLVVDVGNTFAKWARFTAPAPEDDPGVPRWLARGRVGLDRLDTLAQDWRGGPPPLAVVGACVAGPAARAAVARALAAWPGALAPRWIASKADQAGVRNGYDVPESLGVDRWAALVGARAIVGERPVLVAMCGTATTVDLLTADGRFEGGVILPGLEMMRHALHERTAALPLAEGEVVAHPRRTPDAIASGCLHAQAGAIERLWHLHRRAHPELACLVSGGAADAIAPWLAAPHAVRDDLVLAGLARIATDPLTGATRR